MEISTTAHGDILALTLQDDRLDASQALRFKETLRAKTAEHDGRVVIDMQRIQFLDSSGLGALVAGMKLLGGRKLELARCGPAVSKVLSLTHMDRVFVLHEGLPWASDGKDAA